MKKALAGALEAREVIAERPEERLERSRLEPYLRRRLEGAEGALSVRQFGGGHADLTYLLRFGENEFVLRRPPLGPVPPGAHDVAREYRVLSRLYRAYPLAPRALHLCEDESVIGAPFVIEERRHGFVIREDLPPEYAGRPQLNRRIGFALVEALADLHRVDPAAVGLERLGRPEGFLERQVEGWARRWHAALELPEQEKAQRRMAPVILWLEERLPRSAATALVHNDYRLDNLLLSAEDPARVVAVLDWDMCTRGDPLSDLAYVLGYWLEPEEDPFWRGFLAMPTWRPGFPRRAEAIEHYTRRTGFEVAALPWYLAFAAFKLAVIIQQIYIRYRRGQTRDERFRGFANAVEALAQKAALLAGLADAA
jgi:aminoglycoside phosphotransferase (APT) family kinase protein